MTRTLRRWFSRKWQPIDPQLAEDYRLTFSGLHGERVLQHLLDNVYCQICPSTNPNDVIAHNARRSVIQEILENIDQAERPQRYQVTVEGDPHARSH